LANRNTVRAIRIREIIDGQDIDLPTAEAALGHPLRQHHLGAIVWVPDEAVSTGSGGLAHLEQVVAAVGREIGRDSGEAGRPLFCAADTSSGWAWFPRLGGPRPADRVSGSAGPRRSAARPSATTGSRWSWPWWPAGGSAARCSSRRPPADPLRGLGPPGANGTFVPPYRAKVPFAPMNGGLNGGFNGGGGGGQGQEATAAASRVTAWFTDVPVTTRCGCSGAW
jgi:hypothetical protein